MTSETRLREDMVRFGRSLFERGLTAGATGNLSARLDDGTWLATPTNASLGFLDPARLSKLDASGRLLSGDKPTKEIPLHAALYASGRAGAVAHLHSTHCVAWTMTRDLDPACALPALTPYQLMRCGATALVPYHRPGDPKVADAIRALAGDFTSILLANHGPVVSGETLEAAVFGCEELEETCRLALLTRGSRPRLLTRAQVEDVAKTFRPDLPVGRFVCDDGEPPCPCPDCG